MTTLKNTWDRIIDGLDYFLADPGTWFYSIRHRKQRFQIADEHGVTSYYAPEGISPDDWQKMILEKAGGETQNPRDIFRIHTASMLYFIDMVEGNGISVTEAFEKVRQGSPDIKAYVPAALLPLYGIKPDPESLTP